MLLIDGVVLVSLMVGIWIVELHDCSFVAIVSPDVTDVSDA